MVVTRGLSVCDGGGCMVCKALERKYQWRKTGGMYVQYTAQFQIWVYSMQYVQ
jgi:hypothetical protein